MDGVKILAPIALILSLLNSLMFATILGIGGWAMNKAIDHGFVIDSGQKLPAHFSPIYFPMGNGATGFFVIFSLVAGVVGIASIISGGTIVLAKFADARSTAVPSALSAGLFAATIAWAFTLLAVGFASKEIDLNHRNAYLRTMEAFMIILSATQLIYIGLISYFKEENKAFTN